MFLTALTLAALVQTAKAEPTNTAPKPPDNFEKYPSGQPVDIPILQPIRQAKAHVVISKVSFVSVPQGADVSTSTVCDVNVDVPVFDTRGQSNFSWDVPRSSCMSTLKGSPVDVEFAGVITLAGPGPLWPADVKTFSAVLSVPQPPPAPYANQASSGAFTRDLSAHSLGLQLTPEFGGICKQSTPSHSAKLYSSLMGKIQDSGGSSTTVPCQTDGGEFFTGVVEFAD